MGVDVFHVLLDAVSLVVNVSLIIVACRLAFTFKGGIMEKPWRFVCAGASSVAAGSALFSLKNLLGYQAVEMHAAGGSLMLFGGLLALIGIYIEYKTWNVSK